MSDAYGLDLICILPAWLLPLYLLPVHLSCCKELAGCHLYAAVIHKFQSSLSCALYFSVLHVLIIFWPYLSLYGYYQ
jgi:hypothetical protein